MSSPFIPPRPSIPTPNLAPLVRPSGDVYIPGYNDALGVADGIAIANLPRDASVDIDNLTIDPAGFQWSGSTATVPQSNAFSTLHITSPTQGTKEATGAYGAGNTFDWNAMPVLGTTPTPTVLRVVSMPAGGQVYINGTPVNGHWVGSEWEVPIGPVVSSLRIADAAGNARSRTEASQTSVVAGRLRTSWADLTPDSAQVRVVGPHVAFFFDDVLRGRPNAEDAAGNIRRYDIPLGPHTIKVRAEDGYTWTFPVNVAAGTARDLFLIRPAAPPPVIPPTLPGSSTGTLTINGPVGTMVALALAATPTAPLPPGPVPIPASGTITVPVPAGDYVLGAVVNGAVQTRPVHITAGRTHMETFAPAAPAAPAFNARLTVLGVPGYRLAIGAVASPIPLVPPVVIPSTGAVSTQWMAGDYDLVVAPSDGRPAVGQRITVALGDGNVVDTRSWVPAAGSPPATNPPPAASTSVNLTITGTPEWRVTLTPTGTTAFVWRGPILGTAPNGVVVVPVTPGSYELTVEDSAGHSATRTVSIGPGGGTIDTAPYLASALRATQGPTSPAAGTGSIVISGAPPGSVVRAVGVADWTVDTTGRPVSLDVVPGTYGVTVVPSSGPQRVASGLVVTAGGTVPVAYGSMPTPSAVTAGDGAGTGIQPVQTVDQMCGPIIDKPAWVTQTTACPGDTLTGPDGQYRAMAVAGGVSLAKLKADGTVETPMAGTTKLLIAGGVIAAAAVAYYAWKDSQETKGKGGKVENPGKKCSCQSH